MKIGGVTASDLANGERLDARYFAVPAQRIRLAFRKAKDLDLRFLGGENGVAKVTAPARFKRTYAAFGEDSVPYLRPYDVFSYLPTSADLLSETRTEKLAQYRILEGDILQTCSGRNLGPLTLADEYLSQFALSHDMIRVRIEDERFRYYALAFMRTRTGQHLLRGDLSGSVIDHITVEHVSRLAIPVFDDLVASVNDALKRAYSLKNEARIALSTALADLEMALEKMQVIPLDGASPRIWTTQARSLGSRVDAAFHDDLVLQQRAALRRESGVRLGDVAEVAKPGGRYKTYYVGSEFGRPILSGRQLLQFDVVAPKHISTRSIPDGSGYDLKSGWICFQADGRAEEGLGTPVMIVSDRDGWLASGHVGRVQAKDPADAGWLWASLAVSQVQSQIAALACGSVVDALYPEDLQGILLPPRELVDGKAVLDAWNKFAEATDIEGEAIATLEERLQSITGVAEAPEETETNG